MTFSTRADQESYIRKLLVAFDQFANVLLGGHPDETISARSSRAAKEGKWWGRTLVAFLNLIQKNHGNKAEIADRERAETVEYLETKSQGE